MTGPLRPEVLGDGDGGWIWRVRGAGDEIVDSSQRSFPDQGEARDDLVEAGYLAGGEPRNATSPPKRARCQTTVDAIAAAD